MEAAGHTSLLARIGRGARERGRRMRFAFSVALAVLVEGARPSNWTPPLRSVFLRQVLFTGVDAVRFVATIGALVGLAVVLQAHVWLTRLGQTALFGPLLVAVLVREAGPLLVNFVLIGRTGTAIAAELSAMRVTGELHVLDAQGVDPFLYLVVPRGLAVALCAFCLTVLFLFTAALSGYAGGLLIGAAVGRPGLFFLDILRAVRPADVLGLAAKTFVPGLLTAVLCSLEGLGVQGALSEVPQAVSRAVVRSVVMLFVLSALVSLLTYL